MVGTVGGFLPGRLSGRHLAPTTRPGPAPTGPRATNRSPYSSRTRPRPAFTVARRVFSARRRRWDPAVGRVAFRGFRGRFASRSRSSSRARASSRFCSRLRCRVATTVIPEGRCTNRTAVSVLLLICR
jgi:hypothetical protein